MKIYLDDQGDNERKDWVPEGWVLIKTPDEFKLVIEKALKDGEGIEEIDFDNDLGEAVEGRHLVKWLQNEHPEIIMLNPNIKLRVHSKNTVGEKALIHEIDVLRNHYKELIEAKNRPSYEDLFGELDKIK